MSLQGDIRFQKTLALYADAADRFEAEAAEAAARRLMAAYGIDPLRMPDASLYSRDNFADNALLARLRTERRATPKEQAKARAAAKAKERRDRKAAEEFRLISEAAIKFDE
jgi:hypothetical protein